MKEVRIITPTGHLGLTPLERESFLAGCEQAPDVIIADSGSSDIGPRALGADENISPPDWQRSDLEIMLVQARRLGVPLIVGSAADAGTDRGVDSFVAMVRDIATQHGLAPFNLAAIYAEQCPARLAGIAAERSFSGLDGRPPAGRMDLQRSDRVVAVMGAQPIQKALRDGADVVIAGRSSDICLFAAPLLNLGVDPGLAYYAGKVLECASYCAEPFMAKETMLGRVVEEAVYVTPLHPRQRCSRFSIINQTLYERTNPFTEAVPGGTLDLSELRIAEVDERTVRITGPRFRETERRAVKLEGAGRVGERRMAIVGMRDARTIGSIDAAMDYARARVEERYGQQGGWELHFHPYGRNGVLGDWGGEAGVRPHEAGIVIEVVDADGARAHDICAMAMRQILMARLDGVAGGSPVAAPMADEVLVAPPGYLWTLNHLMPVRDFMEPFRAVHARIGG